MILPSLRTHIHTRYVGFQEIRMIAARGMAFIEFQNDMQVRERDASFVIIDAGRVDFTGGRIYIC